MRERTGSRHYSVEEMADLGSGTELIVGARYDPAYGPVVVVGAGGVAAELQADTQVMLWPASRDRVRSALERLAIAPILRGYRGAAPRDLEAVIDAVVSVASVLVDNASIADVEINPVVAHASGVIALDARIIAV
jgi:acyl-CoA synthetase (NDP forming)